ncbi:hypothetical protein [Xanthomonas phage RTH11]|nr:hypothetical protein [Xanthomonas phage RTH11]
MNPLNNPKHHYRPTAHEIVLEQRLLNLNNFVQQLAQGLRTAFPHTPLPGPETVYGGQGPVLTFYDQIADTALLAGHGPRFVAKYHLAENDLQRKLLLDTLTPATDGFNQSRTYDSDIADLTAAYYFRKMDDNSPTEEAPEFLAWLTATREAGGFELIEGHDLRLVAQKCSDWVQYSGPDNTWRLELEKDIRTFSYVPAPQSQRDTYGRGLPDKTFEAQEFVSIPLPKYKGFVLIELTEVNYNRGKRWTPRYFRWLVWSEIERTWCMTSGPHFPVDELDDVARRFLDFVGMPKLDVPSTSEVLESCAGLCAIIKAKLEEWKADLAVYGAMTEYKIILPGVMALTFEGRRSWHSSYDADRVEFQLLDGQLKRHDYIPPMRAVWTASGEIVPLVYMGTEYNDRPVLKGNLNVPTRHRRTVVNAFNAFIQADPSEFEIQSTPNPDYRPPKPPEEPATEASA